MKTFKILFLTFTCITTVSLSSCEEEERGGPLVVDNTIPDPVSEATATNLPGGAKIEYKLPVTPDAAFVRATYKRNGETVSTSASIFKNYVVVEGLREESAQDVTLEVVDKSNNASSPVSVTINPLEAPVDTMFETIDLVSGFGGVGFTYTNPSKIKVEALLYVKDPETGVYEYHDSRFITENDLGTTYTFRTFPPEAQVFAVELVDRWDNITGRYEETITPIEEAELNKRLFKDGKLTGDTATGSFGWVFPRILDNNLNTGLHTNVTSPGILVPPYEEPLHMITIDLGVTRQLSRLVWWQRQTTRWIYNHANPRFYDIWVTDQIPADNGASMESGWTKVFSGEVVQPSGGSGNGPSPADIAQAELGETVEIPLTSPRARYIRFVTKENWSGTKFMHFMEVEVYGSPD